MAFHVDGSQSSNMIGMLADELLERTTCTGDLTVTQEEVLERFIPSVNMMMSQLFGFEGEVNQPENNGKYSKRRRSNVAVIIDRIVFICLFLFYCLLSNHSFPTNPNRITNCFKLFSLLHLTTTLLLRRFFDFFTYCFKDT